MRDNVFRSRSLIGPHLTTSRPSRRYRSTISTHHAGPNPGTSTPTEHPQWSLVDIERRQSKKRKRKRSAKCIIVSEAVPRRVVNKDANMELQFSSTEPTHVLLASGCPGSR
ncbi:hypothetical protein J3458_002233 [Metarhizium acridum]|uniref:uncharacterized protein n=1 Tax=Metarhizium acridum TaxID=92637 RepID=UPI001C6B9080|nr:hypothetical protein J3458_002233 [Metarhizium acridum]